MLSAQKLRGRIKANARASPPMSATMNLAKPVGADLTRAKNLDTSALEKVGNMTAAGHEDSHKVFYNTRGLQMKNSLSNSIRTKSHVHQQ